jgi:hypothetical protein
MSCAGIERRVALYAGGDLDEASARDLERHLAACEGCRVLLTALRVQREAMAEARAAAPSEDDLDDVRSGVLAAIARGGARRSLADSRRFAPVRSVAWGSAGLAAAALLVFAVWTGVLRSNDVKPASRASAQPSRADVQAAAGTAGRPSAPSPANPRADARRELPAPSSRRAAALEAPPVARPQPNAARPGTAGATTAQVSRHVAEDLRAAAAVSDAPPGPMRRIEFQTADPNIRIIWLLPGAAPDPERPREPGR